jgi:hypothetical protein
MITATSFRHPLCVPTKHIVRILVAYKNLIDTLRAIATAFSLVPYLRCLRYVYYQEHIHQRKKIKD